MQVTTAADLSQMICGVYAWALSTSMQETYCKAELPCKAQHAAWQQQVLLQAT
jgi:hypothetical protein